MQQKELFQVIIFFSQFNWELDKGQNCIFKNCSYSVPFKDNWSSIQDQRSKVLRIIKINTGLYSVCVLSHFNRVWLFTTPWTIARQAPLSMGFSSQEYWSGLPCLPSGVLPNTGSNQTLLRFVHWQTFFFFFTISATWETSKRLYTFKIIWG